MAATPAQHSASLLNHSFPARMLLTPHTLTMNGRLALGLRVIRTPRKSRLNNRNIQSVGRIQP